MPGRHPNLLCRDSTVLVVVDMQDSFLRVIHEPERVITNTLLLIEAAKVLAVPILSTIQYSSRLGGITDKVAKAIGVDTPPPIDKLCFSCAGSDSFNEALSLLGRTQVLLCGVETHICICQTALDLVHQGYHVHCAADAVSSRTLERHKLGMERMRDSGILPCAAEGAVFELTHNAGIPEFKAINRLVK